MGSDEMVQRMGELLLDLEWSGSWTNSYDEVEGRACPACCGGHPASKPCEFDSSMPHVGHEHDCELDAILLEAGFR